MQDSTYSWAMIFRVQNYNSYNDNNDRYPALFWSKSRYLFLGGDMCDVVNRDYQKSFTTSTLEYGIVYDIRITKIDGYIEFEVDGVVQTSDEWSNVCGDGRPAEFTIFSNAHTSYEEGVDGEITDLTYERLCQKHMWTNQCVKFGKLYLDPITKSITDIVLNKSYEIKFKLKMNSMQSSTYTWAIIFRVQNQNIASENTDRYPALFWHKDGMLHLGKNICGGTDASWTHQEKIEIGSLAYGTIYDVRITKLENYVEFEVNDVIQTRDDWYNTCGDGRTVELTTFSNAYGGYEENVDGEIYDLTYERL